MFDDDLLGVEDDILENQSELGIDYAIGDKDVEQHMQHMPRVKLTAAGPAMAFATTRPAPQVRGTRKTMKKTIVEVKRDTPNNRLLITFSDGDSLFIIPS